MASFENWFGGEVGSNSHLLALSLKKLFLTTYKSFVRPHPDYGDIIYDTSYKIIL